MILFADYNTPYLFAISFVLLIGLLEIFALICGHMLSGALDAQAILARHFIISILEDCQLSSFSAYMLVFLALLASCYSRSASWSGNHHSQICLWFLSVYC